MGLKDEKDISLRGYELLQQADFIFVDRYTHIIEDDVLNRLEEKLNKKIIKLGREILEDETEVIKDAKQKKVVLLVGGDPLVATTHISLLQTCINKQIPYSIIHSSSILSAAIGESGLQTYKFGKSATLTFWYENYQPTTPYNVINSNQSLGLHTILFIDLKDQEPMDFETIKEIFEKMENKEQGTLLNNLKALVLSRVGYSDQKLTFGKLTNLKNVGKPPFILIIPGKLHFTEEEWLNNFK
jgi:diphthine synthase